MLYSNVPKCDKISVVRADPRSVNHNVVITYCPLKVDSVANVDVLSKSNSGCHCSHNRIQYDSLQRHPFSHPFRCQIVSVDASKVSQTAPSPKSQAELFSLDRNCFARRGLSSHPGPGLGTFTACPINTLLARSIL